MPNARHTAANILLRVLKDGAYSNILLKNVTSLSERDINFCTALVYGVISRKKFLDHIISRYTKKTDVEVRIVLYIGLYEILFMRVPDNASVNESVNLTRLLKKTSACGMVNAVLRNFIRDNKQNDIRKQDLSPEIKFSVNKDIYDLLVLQYDKETAEKFLENALVPPPQSKGRFSQDFSSYLACEALGVKKGDTVLDMCAAPGGKSFAISEIMGGTGRIISLELHGNRVKLIRDGAEKLNIKNITPRQGDASTVDDLPKADKIICDVPCSGIGVIRRKPEIKYKEIPDLSEIQYKILLNSSRFLKQGGELVYSTCTLNRKENDGIIDRFLSENKEFTGIPFLTEKGEPFGTYKAVIFPEHFNSDGFFISKIVKK